MSRDVFARKDYVIFVVAQRRLGFAVEAAASTDVVLIVGASSSLAISILSSQEPRRVEEPSKGRRFSQNGPVVDVTVSGHVKRGVRVLVVFHCDDNHHMQFSLFS